MSVSDLFPESQYPVDDLQKKRSVGTGIHYCRECSNMMIPRIPDDTSHTLQYFCTHCKIYEPADDNRVYVNVLKRTTEDSFISKKLISDDPTLRRETRRCEECDEDVDCVFFVAPTLAGEESMTLMLECTKCHNQWRETQWDKEIQKEKKRRRKLVLFSFLYELLDIIFCVYNEIL